MIQNLASVRKNFNAALEEIIRRIRQLRMDLAGVLSQDLIQAKLPQVMTGQFLPDCAKSPVVQGGDE